MSALPTEKITLKLYAEPATIPPMSAFVEVFQDWIKSGTLEEMLVDVADYGHVHQGPSVLLCGHESDYVIDAGEGRIGLLYRRKRAHASRADAGAGDVALDDSLRRLLRAAAKLESDPRLGGLRFSRTEVALSLVDRLRAPSTEETFSAVAPTLRASLASALGPMSIRRDAGDPRRPFTVHAERAS